MSIPRHWQFPLFIVLVVLVVFFPVTGFDFLVFDDRLHVLDNRLVRNFSLGSFLEFWRRPHDGLYIPLTYVFWGMLAKIAGGGTALTPAPFHIANLLLHAATATVLFSMLRHLVKDNWAALCGALFFALHPLVVESVAWVSELKGLLSGFLSILALRQYVLHGKHGGIINHPSTRTNYLLATLFFAAALLAKPSALIVPLLAGLIGYLWQARPGKELLKELSPWLFLSLAAAIVTKFSQPDSIHPFIPTYWQRLLVAGDALSFYFRKLVYPFNLAPDYGLTPGVVLSGKTIYLTGLLPWFLLPVTLAKKARPWLLVVAIPFCALLPVLGFVPFLFQGTSTVADRYTYLALVGPALAVAMLLERRRGVAVRLGVITFLAGLAVISHSQLYHWRDSPTLNQHINQVNPDSWVAHHSLGVYYQDNQRIDEAIDQYKEAIRIQPGYYPSYYNLAFILPLVGDFAGAVEYCQKFVQMKPDYVAVYATLGNLLIQQNRPVEAAKLFESAVNARPGMLAWQVSLAELYDQLGRKGEAETAWKRVREMEYLHPTDDPQGQP